MRRRGLVRAALGAGAAVLLTSTAARSDDPVTSAVRFNREIVRIFERKCVSCHAPGAIAMPLVTYRDVRPWARAIREEIVEGRMPPISAARGYARLEDDIALTPRELTTILTWLDGGVPKGDDSDLPPAPRPAAAPEPDHEVVVPPQQVPGGAEDVVRHVVVATGLMEDRWVRQVHIRPGDKRLLRAAFVSIVRGDGSEVWAAAWTPWQPDVTPPESSAFLVPRGARLAIEFHYRGQDEPAIDRSTVGLSFAPEGSWRELTSVVLAAPRTVQSGGVASAAATLPREMLVFGGRLEGVADGASVELTASSPDGVIQVLLWIPRFRADWPAPFVFQDPVRLLAGSVITARTGGAEARRVRTVLTVHSSR